MRDEEVCLRSAGAAVWARKVVAAADEARVCSRDVVVGEIGVDVASAFGGLADSFSELMLSWDGHRGQKRNTGIYLNHNKAGSAGVCASKVVAGALPVRDVETRDSGEGKLSSSS
jgi:hypothetical protein